MTTSKLKGSWIRRTLLVAGTFAAALAAIVSVAPARASNLVTNGDFSNLGSGSAALTTTNSQIGAPNPLPSWTAQVLGTNGGIACVMIGNSGNATPMCGTGYAGPNNTYGTLAIFPGSAPGGGNVLAADSSSQYDESISQTINNLTVGAKYSLTFYQAAAQQAGYVGATTDQWNVTFGTSTQSSTLMSVATQSDVPWASQTMIFTATSTSQVLKFLAAGTPASDPPFALLGDIVLTAAPEPASLALLGVGLAGLSVLRRKRRPPVV